LTIRKAFNAAIKDRYSRIKDFENKRVPDETRFQLRVNSDSKEGAIPYAALIAPEQDMCGPYGGMSFVVFPNDESGPALICMGIGTQSIAPDDRVLGKPGHARRCNAIARWLTTLSEGGFAWSKRDPVRTDLEMPKVVRSQLGRWEHTLHRSDVTLVIDAKYKRHAQLVGYGGYGKGEHDWQTQHREDLLQVLAYSSLFDTPRVIACLAYPTPHDQWQTLKDQGRVLSQATVRQGLRQIEIALIAVPMSGQTDEVAALLGQLLLPLKVPA